MKRCIYLLVVAVLSTQSLASAETIRGMITNLDTANDVLIVKPNNSVQQLNVKVKIETRTKNVDSLKELKVGHEVTIDAKQDKASGMYEAKSIEVMGPQASQGDPR